MYKHILIRGENMKKKNYKLCALAITGVITLTPILFGIRQVDVINREPCVQKVKLMERRGTR